MEKMDMFGEDVGFTGFLMSKDDKVAYIVNSILVKKILPHRLPKYFSRLIEGKSSIEGWLHQRFVDKSRINYRMLRRSYRVSEVSLEKAVIQRAFNITDCFWLKAEDDDISFYILRGSSNRAWSTALHGLVQDLDETDITPEFTNVGSYEKCWKKSEADCWFMLKRNASDVLCGSAIAEVVASKIASCIGLDSAMYHIVEGGSLVASKDITEGCKFNLETFASSYLNDSEIEYCFDEIEEVLANVFKIETYQFKLMILLDLIVGNVDRHNHNFGLFTDPSTGEVVRLATCYDNNLSLTGYVWLNGYSTNLGTSKQLKTYLDEWQLDYSGLVKSIRTHLDEIVYSSCKT